MILLFKRHSKVFPSTTVLKHQLWLSLLYGPTLTSVHDYWKKYSFDDMNLCQQSDVSVSVFLFCFVLFCFFNTPSRFVIALLPRRKSIFISWLQSPSSVILEPKKIKSDTVSTFCPSICHEVMEQMLRS